MSKRIEDADPSVVIIERRFDEKGMRIGNFDKILISVIIGIIFFILASPFIFNLTGKGFGMLGVKMLNEKGPTTLGLIIHTVIFIIAVRILMH